MSVLDVVLREEHERINRAINNFSQELDSLPKGYISEKNINGHVYHYLQHRDGVKIRSRYIRNEEFDNLRKLIARRKELEQDIRELKKDRRKIERVLGE